MIKWLEGNPIAMVLASICAGLLLVSLALAVIWSLPPSAMETTSGEEVAEFTLDVPELPESEPIEAYAVITERPVFNESRLPVIGDESAEGDDEIAEHEVDAPDFELAGVVITPSIRMATLKSKDQPESLVAFEGQPLEGNFGSWQISRIEPRQVTLASGRGEEVQLKLQVHDAVIKAPPKPAPENKEAGSDNQAQAGDGENADEPLTRAEEIRQRIAQRREELRAAAENQEADEQAAPADYRSAIKSMINSSNRKKKSDEDDQ